MTRDNHDDLGTRLGHAHIARYAKDHPELDGEAIGQALTADATEDQLRAWAVTEVRETVERLRRAWAREAEDRAAKQARTAADADPSEFEALLEDPAAFYGTRSFYGTIQRRAQFRQWAGDRFGEWYQRARQAAFDARGQQGAEDFESDWHERGIRDYWRQRNAERMEDAIRLAEATTRLEVTAELLGTGFALGDGTETTWGAATVAQHEQRIGMLAQHAAGVVETAARHQAAIGMIKDAGVDCLADLGPGR
jgi:hypothetical protein